LQLPWLALLVAILFVGTLYCAPTLLALICFCYQNYCIDI
jgi:hypothetical protein